MRIYFSEMRWAVWTDSAKDWLAICPSEIAAKNAAEGLVKVFGKVKWGQLKVER